jgi:CheY-like chemotaxis protein
MTGPGSLAVLAVDDEPPALSELAYLLGRDPRVGRVRTAGDGATALRILQDEHVDALFLDIRMPGLTGLDLARVLARFRRPPQVVFVTAYDDQARTAGAARRGRATGRRGGGGATRRRGAGRPARREHPGRARGRDQVRQPQ